MASGTLTTKYSGWTYRIYWSSTTSVEDNTSTVVCDHWLVMDSGYSISIGSRNNTCTVGSDTKAFTSPAISAKGTTVALGSTTHTVPHNSDGSMSAALSSTFNVNATLAGVKQNSWTITATLTLDTIPRTSKVTLSSSTFELGSYIEIYTNRASGSFKHSIYYSWMGSGWTRIADNVETYEGWTPKVETFAPSIPKATKGQGVIYCETYLNGKYIGTSSASFEATLPASVKPEVAVLLDEPTGLADKYGALVQGRSTIRVQTDGIEAYGSAISRYDVIVDGLTYKDRDITTKEVTGANGLVAIKVTATDERGRTSDPFEASLTVLEYQPPAVTALSVHRCDADGAENDQGEYVQVTFSASVTSLNGYNSATYTLRCGALSSDMELTDISGDYTVTSHAVEPFEADGSSTYTIEVEAADDFTTGNRTTSVSTAFTLINWGPSGRSMAIGKVAEILGALEIALASKFLGDVYGRAYGLGNLPAIPSDADLNTYTEPGVYCITLNETAEKVKNAPPCKVAGRLIVSASNGEMTGTDWDYREQIFLPYNMALGNGSGWTRDLSRRGSDEWVGNLWYSTAIQAYPVNSIYINYSHTDPATLFGGAWERIENRFLYGVPDQWTIGHKDGEASHTLTENEMPRHKHPIVRPKWYGADGNGTVSTTHSASTSSIYSGQGLGPSYQTTPATSALDIQYAGGGAAHNNMPPYIQVSIWWRTA